MADVSLAARVLPTTLLLLACSQPVTPGPNTAPPPAAGTSASGGCRAGDPLAGVYHPQRLQVLAACAQVTGTIGSEKPETDGDLHVRVRLDPGQERYLNSFNDRDQQGDLVVELICVGQVTQADAVSACAANSLHVAAPPTGTHVRVTGPWVTDLHHGWNEIHPVNDIEPI